MQQSIKRLRILAVIACLVLLINVIWMFYNITKFIDIYAWLYRIATNEINQYYRKIKRLVPMSLHDLLRLPDIKQADSDLLETEARNKNREHIRRLHAVLARLHVKYQTVLSLRYFERKSIKEISEILNIPENTVKTRIRRGLIALKKL